MRAGRVVLTADAWTNDCSPARRSLPLTVLREQVTYFAPGAAGCTSAPTAAGVDLDGRPVLLRLPDVPEGGQARW